MEKVRKTTFSFIFVLHHNTSLSAILPFFILKISSGSHYNRLGEPQKKTLRPLWLWLQGDPLVQSTIFSFFLFKTCKIIFLLNFFTIMNLIFQDVVPSDSGQYECQVQLLQNKKYFSGCQDFKKQKCSN